ncbi:MAG: hypothetical protein PHC62_04170 [Candidatus Izemoplasmatales bacterium]|nr:hypothetical protein [Candidatus Izemoplasmatales bacterium]
MNQQRFKKRFILSLAMLIFSLSLFAFSTYAWFTYLKTDTFFGEVGFVEVDLNAYFLDELHPATEVEVAAGVPKPGVYLVNIVSSASSNYFEDFRLSVSVLSNVDTYMRVKIYEQLTLTYTNFEGIVTELSILHDEYMPFNYDTTNWYDNREIDNYIYYKLPVKRVDASNALIVGIISSYFSGQSFSNYPPGYSLQIAFSIEAVQALSGPVNVWELTTPPWGGTW